MQKTAFRELFTPQMQTESTRSVWVILQTLSSRSSLVPISSNVISAASCLSQASFLPLVQLSVRRIPVSFKLLSHGYRIGTVTPCECHWSEWFVCGPGYQGHWNWRDMDARKPWRTHRKFRPHDTGCDHLLDMSIERGIYENVSW